MMRFPSARPRQHPGSVLPRPFHPATHRRLGFTRPSVPQNDPVNLPPQACQPSLLPEPVSVRPPTRPQCTFRLSLRSLSLRSFPSVRRTRSSGAVLCWQSPYNCFVIPQHFLYFLSLPHGQKSFPLTGRNLSVGAIVLNVPLCNCSTSETSSGFSGSIPTMTCQPLELHIPNISAARSSV